MSFLFVLFRPLWDFPPPPFFWNFPICSGMDRGFPRLSFASLSACQEHLRGTVPKGSATQSGPFSKKWENPPVWKTPVELLSNSGCRPWKNKGNSQNRCDSRIWPNGGFCEFSPCSRTRSRISLCLVSLPERLMRGAAAPKF